jgi:hypothetical protein
VTETPPPERKRGRLWISLGEGAAVLAVAIAALSYWDTHREHVAEAGRAAQESQARSAFVIRAAADAAGRRLTLDAVEPGQVIQSQRYIFPRVILDHAMEVAAARPQIDVAWIDSGLDRALGAAHVKGDGEARLPVAIVSEYVEDGETRQDKSLYVIGYKWRPRFLGGRQIILEGLSLRRRAVAGDLQAQVDRDWRAPPSR